MCWEARPPRPMDRYSGDQVEIKDGTLLIHFVEGNDYVEKLFAWLDERLGLNDLYKATLDRPNQGQLVEHAGKCQPVPLSAPGATGIFLSVYYTPSPDHAYDSIQYIMNDVAFGWLIRGIHHWGATLMVLVVFIHMIGFCDRIL